MMKQDKQLQEIHKVQRSDKEKTKHNTQMLNETVRELALATKEIISLKVQLQVQKDTVLALKLKYDTDFEQSVVKEPDTIKQPEAENYEEGPLTEDMSKCDKCNFKSKNRVLLEEHKEKKHKKLQCLMCGKISNNHDSFKKHHENHMKELNKGSINSYPIELQDFKCTKCSVSFRCHNDLMEHLVKIHLNESQCQETGKHLAEKKKETSKSQKEDTSLIKCKNGQSSQCSWAVRGRCKFDHNGEAAPNVENVKTCRNGEACRFKAQGRCTHYHSDVGVQYKEMKPPRQTPSIQWQTVPAKWQKSQQSVLPKRWQSRQESTFTSSPRSYQPQAWQQEVQPKVMMTFPVPPPFPQPQTQQHNGLSPLLQHNKFMTPTNPTLTPQAQAWCKHGAACNLGRFCILRHFSDEDFIQLQRQMLN